MLSWQLIKLSLKNGEIYANHSLAIVKLRPVGFVLGLASTTLCMYTGGQLLVYRDYLNTFDLLINSRITEYSDK